MSLLKTRPKLDALQRIMSSFKQFEMKLDKLREDVSYHGKTLNDLRSMVCNLSGGAMTDVKPEHAKQSEKKTTAMQYDHLFEEPLKRRKKKIIQPFPTKLNARSLESPRDRMYDMPFPNKLNASPKGSPGKRSHKSIRPTKADTSRKVSTLRTGKNLNKKRSKLQKA